MYVLFAARGQPVVIVVASLRPVSVPRVVVATFEPVFLVGGYRSGVAREVYVRLVS